MQYNKCMLAGYLTRDPELKHVGDNGTALVKFGLAVNESYGAGEKKLRATFVDVLAWGKLAETIAEWFKKGKPIFIEGRLQFSQWEARDGSKRSRLEVVADQFRFLSSKDDGDDKPF